MQQVVAPGKAFQHGTATSSTPAHATLSQAREIIRQTTQELFGGEASERLFGARLDDSLHGGNVDLLVKLFQHGVNTNKKSPTLVARLQMRLSDRPVDVLVLDPETVIQPIHLAAVAARAPV